MNPGSQNVFSDFAQKFTSVVKGFEDRGRKGLFNAAGELLQDADNVEPKTPKKWGDLKGSKKIEIVDKGGDPFVKAGFNIEYAHHVHEMVSPAVNWTEPGSGAKYLESKLTRFWQKYLRIIANTISGVNG